MEKAVSAALRSFDGRDAEQGNRIVEANEPTTELFRELLDRIGKGDRDQQSGGTWLIKAYLEHGARLDRALVGQLGGILEKLSDWEGQLHVCQCVRFLSVPQRNTGQFARFLRSCMNSEIKFLRAWAYDAFFRLGQQHPRFAEEVQLLLDQAARDPAPSVRARVRNLR